MNIDDQGKDPAPVPPKKKPTVSAKKPAVSAKKTVNVGGEAAQKAEPVSVAETKESVPAHAEQAWTVPAAEAVSGGDTAKAESVDQPVPDKAAEPIIEPQESTPTQAQASTPQETTVPYPTAAYSPTSYTGAASTPLASLTPPKRKGNRRAGILIALLATIVYAAVYAGVAGAIISYNVSMAQWAKVLGQFVTNPAFYIPVASFGIALILIVLIVNRAGWWAYVLGGFLVAVIVYAATILGAYVAVHGWTFSANQVSDFVGSLVMDPLTIAGALVAREVTIWMGAWIGGRGHKVKVGNRVEREEYDHKIMVDAPVIQYSGGPSY